MTTLACNAVFLSDLHLGACWSDTNALLAVLQQLRPRRLYLVGDVVDFALLRQFPQWPAAGTAVLRALLELGQAGSELIWLPGNHDDCLRHLGRLRLGSLDLCEQVVHTTVNGRRYLVLHGDQCDGVVTRYPGLAWLGGLLHDRAYRLLRWLQPRLSARRRTPSLVSRVKSWVKQGCLGISAYREALLLRARQAGADGVICGHVHSPSHDVFDGGMEYLNCGDWVENCTLVIETMDGRLELLRWDEAAGLQPLATAAPQPVAELALAVE
ncbi:MAG: UDP-2,3-diacylglucosamine diphosphatase [Fimbriimonadaceae bacterium]|nr:UDP-2,3-diacylglucosamine diphosphatase [Fimbriimonadaceae bacterium]